MPLLSPELLGRLEALQLSTRRRLAGALVGEHRSTRRGSSIDFADHRPYHPGDDYRRIDFHLYARLDVLLLKLYEAEDDLAVRLMVDTSGSMAGAKLRQAATVAGALGFVGLVRRDPVSLHTFPTRGPAPRFTGRHSAVALFAALDGLEAGGTTDFATAARDLLARPGPPGLTVVLSDLLTPEWEDALVRLPGRGAEVLVVHVLGREDLASSLVGDLELVDRETGEVVSVSLSPETVAAHRRTVLAWADRVAARCRHVGAEYLRVFDDDDVGRLLVGGWRDAGILR